MPANRRPYHLLKHPMHCLSLGLGSGLLPGAPGTWGALAALPLACLGLLLPDWVYLLIIVISFILGIYLCNHTATRLGQHDHPAIVWDEWVGLWISLLPLAFYPYHWRELCIGFILFRCFDITKPWPINRVDRTTRGGLGIMLDDVLAGLLAAASLWTIIAMTN